MIETFLWKRLTSERRSRYIFMFDRIQYTVLERSLLSLSFMLNIRWCDWVIRTERVCFQVATSISSFEVCYNRQAHIGYSHIFPFVFEFLKIVTFDDPDKAQPVKSHLKDVLKMSSEDTQYISARCLLDA